MEHVRVHVQTVTQCHCGMMVCGYMCMSAPMPCPVKRSTTCRKKQHAAMSYMQRARETSALAPNPAWPATLDMMRPMTSKGTPGPHAAKTNTHQNTCNNAFMDRAEKCKIVRKRRPIVAHLRWHASCSRGCSAPARALQATAFRRRTCGNCRHAHHSRSCITKYQQEQRCLMFDSRKGTHTLTSIFTTSPSRRTRSSGMPWHITCRALGERAVIA